MTPYRFPVDTHFVDSALPRGSSSRPHVLLAEQKCLDGQQQPRLTLNNTTSFVSWKQLSDSSPQSKACQEINQERKEPSKADKTIIVVPHRNHSV